jgi:hypothetical protein
MAIANAIAKVLRRKTPEIEGAGSAKDRVPAPAG